MKEEKDERIEKKPVEVFKEILVDIPQINLNDLDKQIKTIKQRVEVLKDHVGQLNFSDEERALMFLEARKGYNKYGKHFAWKTTTEELTRKLCSTYKLRRVPIDGYYRTIPTEGIEEIKKFAYLWEKVLDPDDYKPKFSLIIDDGGKETKKDPILLATSPFGNWYYVLGAWDKEVEYVDDLIYKGK